MTIRPLYPASRPSLDLNFAKTKRLDPRISFSRASSGTYIGNDGLLKSAAINEARFDHSPSTGESLGLLVEEARTNLFTNSEQLQTWASLMYDILVPNQIQGPSGLINAVKHVPSTISWGHIIYQNVAFSAVPYTLSVYAKPAGYNFLHVSGSAWGSWASYINFDLSNGTLAAGTGYSSYSITALANGWYRCSVTFTPAAGTNWVGFGAANLGTNLPGGFAGNGTSGIYLWGAQLEAGSFPTSYIPTPATFTSRASSATYYDANGVIQTASTNVARSAAYFPDSNGVMRPAGLLLEAAGTNLVTYSEQFDNAAWTKDTGIGVTANTTASPDGASTAETATHSSAAGGIFQNTTAGAGTHTFSIFLKYVDTAWVRLVLGNTSDNAVAWFNVSAGTVGSTAVNGTITSRSSSIQKLSNGWYRCTLTAALTTTNVNYCQVNTATADSSNTRVVGSFYVWGAQLEASPYPTSYIPTTTATVTRSADVSSSATVTRSADVAQIGPGTNFSSWYNQTAGTLLGNFRTVNTTQGGVCGPINSGGSDIAEGFVIQASTAQLRGINYLDSGSTNNDIVNNSPQLGLNRIAIAGSTTDDTTGAYFNGLIGSVNASRTQGYINVAGIKIGERSGQRLTGTISRLTYWPTRLSDAILQSLTQ